MPNSQSFIPHAVSIHDSAARGFLDFDLGDLLAVLRSDRPRKWVVEIEDLSGRALAEATAAEIERRRLAREPRLVLDEDTFARFADDVTQTLDAEFVAVDAHLTDDEAARLAADYANLLSEPVLLVILAIRGSYWIVLTKSWTDVTRLRDRFRDVRNEDPWAEIGIVPPSPPTV
ncbi:MAG: hypothetical protein H0V74_01850 [Chloroflexi bacterium]|nr:hypothetical protein [Chloroflexota bacterium]